METDFKANAEKLKGRRNTGKTKVLNKPDANANDRRISKEQVAQDGDSSVQSETESSSSSSSCEVGSSVSEDVVSDSPDSKPNTKPAVTNTPSGEPG